MTNSAIALVSTSDPGSWCGIAYWAALSHSREVYTPRPHAVSECLIDLSLGMAWLVAKMLLKAYRINP